MKLKSQLLPLFLCAAFAFGCGGKSDSSSSTGTLEVKGAAAAKKLGARKSIGAGTPAVFKLLVTKVWLGENANCSDAVLVGDTSANPEYLDFIQNPTLLSGSLPPGTYNCMIIQMYDTILFKTPSSITNPGVHTGCTANTVYGMDIFRDSGEVWYDYDNNTTTAASGDQSDSNALTTLAEVDAYPGRQITSTFFSTGSPAVIKAEFPDFHQNGADYYQYMELSSAITITAGQTKTISMTWDFSNQLSGDGTDMGVPLCWVESPSMTIE